MKKRLLSWMICAVMVLTMLPVTVFATEIVDSGYCGGEGDGNNLTWTLDSQGTLTIAGNGEMRDYYYGWGLIAPWDANADSIISIVIENGVTSIGQQAFNDCKNVTSVTIPKSVVRMGQSGFFYCNKLSYVFIEDIEAWCAIDFIGEYANPILQSRSLYVNGQLLKNLMIPDGVSSINAHAFSWCDSLETVTIPNSVTNIGNYAFHGCFNINSVMIPDGVTSIGDYAFGACTRLTGVHIPESVSYIGRYAFYYTSLASIIIPEQVTSIAPYTFDRCGKLTNVSIPESVTSIGDYAFVECGSLTEVKIPDSVITIGNHAFEKCKSLTCVQLSKKLASIGNYAFANCNSLTQVTLPESVTSIGEYAFFSCYGISNIHIPSGVSVINEFSFGYCSNLTDVEIHSSVSEIMSDAFNSCALTKITLPEGINSIRYQTFYGCTNLVSVTIPSSVTSVDTAAFNNCIGLKDVYYGGTLNEWMRIQIGEYNSSLLDATLHCTGVTLKDIPDGKYAILVVDEDDKAIADADVTWDSQSQITDDDGYAIFDRYTVNQPHITVSKDGYTTWSNQKNNWKKSEDRCEIVILYPAEYGDYKLAFARYSNSEDTLIGKDLLTKTKKLSLPNDGHMIYDGDDGFFYISCCATNPTNVKEYQLYQNQTKVAVTNTGSFDKLSVRQFSKGGNCFIRVVTNDSKEVDTHINLEFAENKVNDKNEFSLASNKISITVDDNIPFVGGTKLDFDLPIKSPVTLLLSENKIRLGFNANLANRESKEGQFDKLKDLMTKADLAKDIGFERLNAQDRKLFETLIADKNNTNPTLFGKKPEINFLGYAEADIGSSVAKGRLMLQIKLDIASMEYNTWVVVVPVTVQLKLGLSGGVFAEFSYDWANATVSGNVDAEIKPKLTAFGGVGVSKFVGVGAYGEAELAAKLHLIVPPVYFKSVDLTGELGLKAYLGALTYERPFAHNTWYLYTANSVRSANRKPLHAAPWKEGIYDAENYQVDDLSYLAEESGWLSGKSMRTVRATRGGGAKTELQSLLTDTYRNAKPVMISDGSMLYAVFIRANVENGERYAVLTKYDGSSWTTPVRVDNSAILDSAPTLCVHNGIVYLAYSRTIVALGSSLLAYAQNQQIVVGTVDPGTLAFTEQAAFDGEGYATMPALFDNGGELTLMWLDADVTDENSVLQPASGTIRYATLNTSRGVQTAMRAAATVSTESDISTATDLSSATDLPVEASSIQINSVPAMGTRGVAAWGEAEDLTHVNGTVNSITPGIYGGELAAAYVSDGKLYCTAGGTPALLAEDVSGKVTFAVLPGTDQPDFIWNSEGSLHTADGVMVSAADITSEYQIVGSNIYYSAASNGGANLTVLQYHDGSGWGVPMQLTGGERYLENLSAAALDGNDYVFGMHTAVTITEDTVTDAKNLVWARVTAVNDLRITGVDYDDEGATAGDEIPVSVTVLNGGDHTVNSVELSVNGTTVKTVDTALAPSQETTIETTVTCPETLTEFTFTVNEPDENDYSPENNSESISFGYADVAIEMQHQRIGSSQALVAVVTNQGVGAVDGSVTFYDANGEAVAERTFSSLESGGAAIAECPIDETFAGYRGGDVTAVVTLNQEERYLFNNEANMYLAEKGILLTGTTGQSGSGTATIYEDGTVLLQTDITDGTFRFDNVYSGDYTLELRQDGFATDRMTLGVEKGGPAQRELQRHLIARGNVNGVVNAFGNAADTDDMQCLFMYLSTGMNEGQITDSGYFNCVADVNEDGAVNILDYQALYELVKSVG